MSVYGSIAQVRVERVSHLISHPSHPLTRHMLTTHYGLPSSEAQSSKIKGGQGQVVTGSTVEPLTALPRANRRDAQVRERGPFKSLENSVLAQWECLFLILVQLTPPAIGVSDAQRGLLSLVERGLIPVSQSQGFDYPVCACMYTIGNPHTL